LAEDFVFVLVYYLAGHSRAYREFSNEPPDAPWDQAATFDAIYQVAKARGIEAEF
jgi:hypothetical protein